MKINGTIKRPELVLLAEPLKRPKEEVVLFSTELPSNPATEMSISLGVKLCLCFLLSCMLVGATSFQCPPCDISACEDREDDECRYGTVEDSCGCCLVCGGHPGHVCSIEYGGCGRGLHCFVDIPGNITSQAERLTWPGACRFIANGMPLMVVKGREIYIFQFVTQELSPLQLHHPSLVQHLPLLRAPLLRAIIIILLFFLKSHLASKSAPLINV